MRYLIITTTLLMGGFTAKADECPVLAVTGMPTLTVEANTQLVCHAGYAAQVDLDKLVPRWVAYDLTGPHTLGCFARQNNFHADTLLPVDHRATPADYAKSGYDIGHQQSAADAEWNAQIMSDTFALSNMAPQLPGLNRMGWEDLEEHVRAWAWQRGDVIVFVGPSISPNDTTIGSHKVDVPQYFWKVVYDPKTEEAMAFVMPQETIPKGNLSPWQTTVQHVEFLAGIKLPIASDRTVKPSIWPSDIVAWHKAHSAACPAGKSAD